MNGTTLLIEVGGVCLIAGMLWYAKWQGDDDAVRDDRLKVRRMWPAIDNAEYRDWLFRSDKRPLYEKLAPYTYGLSEPTPDHVPTEWEKAA